MCWKIWLSSNLHLTVKNVSKQSTAGFRDSTYVTRFEKTNPLAQQVKCILLLHIIDAFIHYQNTVIDYQEMARSAFPRGLFLAMQNTEKPIQMVWDLWGFNRMAWTQSISQMLVSSSVVVCNWCDDLFGMGLELGVPLDVFFLTVATTHPRHSSNYSHAGKSLKQGKLSVMIRPLYLEL